ncbi:MAG: hypothetical protein VKN72_00110 [Nostocales cyanobacterium 94392]|nr:hypothetical protein [Nostocales cyanobacterium 94392]
MLTHQRKHVSLSIMSTDLPVESVVESTATLYQKDNQRFHLLLNAPPIKTWQEGKAQNSPNTPAKPAQANARVSGSPRILWLEISPYRVTMTMQGNPHLSYRHFWEKGIYGMNRYWLPSESLQNNQPIRLRNFTRNLTLIGHPLPEHLRLEYELWSGKLQLGNYILNLEIHN